MELKTKLPAETRHDENKDRPLAQVVTSPECLSASVLTICQEIDRAQINEMVAELSKQSAAVHNGDLSRAESMLIAQAHTLDGVFAKLMARALNTGHLDVLERYMRLALKAQNQARATLQTLAELKTPKQVTFLRQANIGRQVQVNNDNTSTRTRKTRNKPNELLETSHGERLDGRTTGTTGDADTAMAALAEEHRPGER